MSNWGNAIAGAVGAVANVGSQALDRQLATADKIEAEKRAADLQLDLHQRMAAADEMMKNRAAERFATLTKQKLGEDVPLEAPGVDKTGLTDDSRTEFTTQDGSTASVAFHGDTSDIVKRMQAKLNDPSTSAEDKADARAVLDGIQAQASKQADINAKGVDGKTRKRTVKEARDAAFDEAAVNDAPAFMAGRSMWKDAMQDDRTDAKDKVAQDDKDADRASREKIAGMTTEQRAKAAADRAAVARERIESLAGGKGAKATALMQNYEFMVKTMGKTPEEAQQILFHAKDSSEAEKVFKLLMHDKFGEMTPEEAFKKVRGIQTAGGGSQPAPAADAKPAGRTRKWNPATQKFE